MNIKPLVWLNCSVMSYNICAMCIERGRRGITQEEAASKKTHIDRRQRSNLPIGPEKKKKSTANFNRMTKRRGIHDFEKTILYS